MDIAFTIEDIVGRFETFRVGVVVATRLALRAERPPELERLVREAEAQAGALLSGLALAEIAALKAWREAYKAFGVKKTSYRSSVERLLKRVQQGGRLPEVNTLVDTYNAVSLRHLMPVGADDLARVISPLCFRFARAGDTFIALGDAAGEQDPPAPGEVVYADAEKCLCRRWNWMQDARSGISAATTGAVLTVQALGAAGAAGTRVEDAVAELCAALATVCGARTIWAVADRYAPSIALPLP
jgi:DNA/RNA-binding domain of Phe-tRNA-synthetase-like protein